MLRNILGGMIFFGTIALSSCSTQNKLTSTDNNDDVYNTKAKAGDQPVYAVRQNNNQSNIDSDPYVDDDYGYYDSYAARLNRFYNYSPFISSYYDGLYYGGYTPYYSGYGLGFGLGYGFYGGGYFGYNPYSYDSYYGYNPYWGYSNYGYYGSTIGYGVSPYWGTYSYYNVARNYGGNSNSGRPYRGSGYPNIAGGRGLSSGAVNPATQAYTGGRPTQVGSTTVNGTRQVYSGRPQRDNGQTYQPQQQQQRPQSQPQSQPTYSAPASSGSSGGGGDRGARPGGGRP